MRTRWEPLLSDDISFFDEVLRGCMPGVAFDAGCNEGGFIEKFLDFGASEVFGFEPVPDVASRCKKRFSGNPKVTVSQLGISDIHDFVDGLNVFNTWSLFPHHGGRNDIAIEYKDSSPFGVMFVPLDSIGIKPDFIKIDVDGYEFRALKGARNILNLDRPPIYFEFSHLPKFILGEDVSEMCRFIYDHGYKAVSLDGWRCPDPETMMSMYPDGSSYDILLMP